LSRWSSSRARATGTVVKSPVIAIQMANRFIRHLLVFYVYKPVCSERPSVLYILHYQSALLQVNPPNGCFSLP
jgi:hypothetical protein